MLCKVGIEATHEGNGWEGIRTPGALRHTRFPGVHNRPLCHPSFRILLAIVIVRSIDYEHEHELQLQPAEQFIERQLNADKKFTKIRVLRAHWIKTHFVNDFLNLESIARKERYAPFGIVQSS